jgi:hypothetical protein
MLLNPERRQTTIYWNGRTVFLFLSSTVPFWDVGKFTKIKHQSRNERRFDCTKRLESIIAYLYICMDCKSSAIKIRTIVSASRSAEGTTSSLSPRRLPFKIRAYPQQSLPCCYTWTIASGTRRVP